VGVIAVDGRGGIVRYLKSVGGGVRDASGFTVRCNHGKMAACA
jgi:hypothetical protein